MVHDVTTSDISTEVEKLKEAPSFARQAEEEGVKPRSSKCNFVYKGTDHYPVPVVDLKGRLHDADPEIRAAIVQEVSEAAKVGSFCLVNNGIDPELILRYRRAVNEFFALPQDEKVKYSKISIPGICRPVGYQGQFKNLTQKAPVVQRREVFEIQGTPAEKRDLVPWPQSVPSLREEMELYADELGKLTRWVCEAMAEGLGLSSDAFLKQVGGERFHQQIVACSYPIVERQPELGANPSSIGFGAHSDLPVMNTVVEDDVGGVQVYHDDQWMDTKPITEGVTFFVGDPMECMSNGIYHAMLHRVLAPKTSSRFSCVSTFEPFDKDTAVLQPVPELVEKSGQPAKYVAFNYTGRAKSIMNQQFNPEIMTKRFMVTDFSVLDSSRNFSYRDGVFHIGSHPLGSVTEGY